MGKMTFTDLSHFLTWAKGNNLLFHGSNLEHLTEITPRQSNCGTSAEGNYNAVFATDDYHLAIYYAILDKKKRKGLSIARKTIVDQVVTYTFGLEKAALRSQPFCGGHIHSLERTGFVEVLNSTGFNTSEWYSLASQKIIQSFEVGPENFEHFKNIVGI